MVPPVQTSREKWSGVARPRGGIAGGPGRGCSRLTAMSTGASVVFLLVIGTRLFLPLAIPRWPLPALIACLVVDGVDQTVFQLFGYDPPGYQSYDKAMDVWYLAIAYLATMRNWQSLPAYRVGQFLYFYRLVGVMVFELTHVRALLLVFANTFEYFFIAYEAVRMRWSPLRLVMKGWLLTAAAIWVFIKLPQEYWIHVAQLDLTDAIKNNWWFGPLIAIAIVALLAVFWFVVKPRLPAPDWGWRLEAEPLPEEMDTAAEQAAWRADNQRVRSAATVEKVCLTGLITVIFSQTLPGVKAGNLELFIGVAFVVVANTAISLAASRRGRSIESMTVGFIVRTVINIGVVVAAEILLGPGPDVNAGATIFYLMMISVLTQMHDRWSPVLGWRQVEASEGRTAAL
jgi:hypothetical protein